ncbi:UDP-glucose 4-epimerase GalE [Stenotrophomonas geniculata]|jgi:UDP-glucose 4-epimerase|uniref:UDP-glucose 4-epimerase n=1 Tax=Stenotrophomonas geniculata TaxID=86188 RepID=A0ABW1N3I8_9GAMM|nr:MULTISPECIES: UDP-glucose 4-epimerase GalE [Stenotrophomonas]MCI1066541.1 UDP-glucose 4-epimerase GalE [Stenotrophomonas maltophilia]MCI1091434.1 UDP-glucose 4-epimerase GalE [Stenotrophomonas maltophilia]MCI1107661.1 UDP-glucose 4-epimerase GalE [Stenotrophomonas maltophilia]MCI1129333.1 UDP-glucose 4-epimerase GalE [Stenotrophomonas maltophilia]MCU1017303.1 UDP-glucose 4-epimerase GalE [Stenotrophomonas maltophilia]
MNILVTGGLGFIGSHTCVDLLARGNEVTILDNLDNSQKGTLEAIKTITGKPPVFIEGDVRDGSTLRTVLQDHQIDAVIHFAALKSVGESWKRPLDYFDNNISGTITLLQAMEGTGVRNFVFSSSATVYGDPDFCPIPESAATRTTNPYGRTKLICEQLLADKAASDPKFRVATLRYFNPVGAHPSGLIGEAPTGTPNNLMPYVSQVAFGQREYLQVFGDDYETHDGTGVRDYIHVMDLAAAHVRALDYITEMNQSLTVNLGTGKGYSVLDVVAAFERASGRSVPFRVVARRPGDAASCFADPSLAHGLLGWTAERSLDQMCVDAWRWQVHNDRGPA